MCHIALYLFPLDSFKRARGLVVLSLTYQGVSLATFHHSKIFGHRFIDFSCFFTMTRLAKD